MIGSSAQLAGKMEGGYKPFFKNTVDFTLNFFQKDLAFV